jgi:hypothetical protein
MKDKENLNLNQNFRLSVEKYKKEDFTNLTSHYIAERDEDLREKTLKNDTTQQELKLKKDISQQELELKKGICAWVKWIVSVYLIFIAYILLLLVLNEGKLESSVVIALLTTTTINILGLPYMIIKSLFPEKKN